MSSEKIINDIIDTNLAQAKKEIQTLLYEKMSMSLCEKKTEVPVCETCKSKDKKKKDDEYAPDTDEEDDGEGLDDVGAEDSDVDNDGDSDESDSYLKARRRIRGSIIQKEDKEQLDEFIPLAMMAVRAIGGRLLKKGLKHVGKKALGAVGGMLGGGGEEQQESRDVGFESDDTTETLYGMDKDRYMRLPDEEKDKVRLIYHREQKKEDKDKKRGPVKIGGKKDKK